MNKTTEQEKKRDKQEQKQTKNQSAIRKNLAIIVSFLLVFSGLLVIGTSISEKNITEHSKINNFFQAEPSENLTYGTYHRDPNQMAVPPSPPSYMVGNLYINGKKAGAGYEIKAVVETWKCPVENIGDMQAIEDAGKGDYLGWKVRNTTYTNENGQFAMMIPESSGLYPRYDGDTVVFYANNKIVGKENIKFGEPVSGIKLQNHGQLNTPAPQTEANNLETNINNQSNIPFQFFQQNENMNMGYSAPIIMALIPTEDGGYKRQVLNFSFAMFQQGEWSPMTLEPGQRVMFYAVGNNMNPLNGYLKFNPPTESVFAGGENMGSMAMMFMMQGMENQGSMWQNLSMMAMMGEGKMNWSLWQLMQNNGRVDINNMGFATFQVPEMNGLWRATAQTEEGSQGFFFQVKGTKGQGSESNKIDIGFDVDDRKLDKGTSDVIYLVVNDKRVNEGELSFNGGRWQTGGSGTITPEKDVINVEVKYQGETYSKTLYTVGYKPGGRFSDINWVTLFLGILIVGAVAFIGYRRYKSSGSSVKDKVPL